MTYIRNIFLYTIALMAVLTSCQNRDDDHNEPAISTPADFTQSDLMLRAEDSLSARTISFLNETAFSKYIASRSREEIDWNGFALKGFWKEDSLSEIPFTPARSFFNLYGPFLKYSPDSSMFIDLDSYNIRIHRNSNGTLVGVSTEADSEVSLINLKTNQKKRMLFLGPGNAVEDAAWIDNEKFILLGYEENEIDTSFRAVIYKFDLASQTCYLYELEDSSMVRHLKAFSRKGRLKNVTLRR